MKSQGAAKNEVNNAGQKEAAAKASVLEEKINVSNVKIGPLFEATAHFERRTIS